MTVVAGMTFRAGPAATRRFVKPALPASVVIRPLQGDVPTIDLVLGYSRSNTSVLYADSLFDAVAFIAVDHSFTRRASSWMS